MSRACFVLNADRLTNPLSGEALLPSTLNAHILFVEMSGWNVRHIPVRRDKGCWLPALTAGLHV